MTPDNYMAAKLRDPNFEITWKDFERLPNHFKEQHTLEWPTVCKITRNKDAPKRFSGIRRLNGTD